MKSENNITNFFAGQTIFITGGTGFVGKVLIEKLLRSCPKIARIYILIRETTGKSVEDKIKRFYASAIFATITETNPNFEEKLTFLTGNIAKINLGLNANDIKKITNNVNIIYHLASSISFDENLDEALLANTRGTREICKIAGNMKKLKVFIHGSTCYSQTDKYTIEETVYDSQTNWQKYIEIAENVNPYTCNILANKLAKNYPNTYTFTKRLAENVVSDMCSGKFPTVIFRTSIVSSVVNEPIEGWIDNIVSPAGVCIITGKGLVRSWYANEEANMDLVPCDVVVKGLIKAAWKAGLEKPTNISVYNATSRNNLPILKTLEHISAANNKIPMEAYWYPNLLGTSSYFLYCLNYILFQLLPALTVDSIFYLFGKEPYVYKLQRKVFYVMKSLRYYQMNNWCISNDLFYELYDACNAEDKVVFGFGDDLEMEKYCKIIAAGAKRFLLYEDITVGRMEQVQFNNKILWFLNTLVKCITCVIVFKVLQILMIINKI